MSRAAFLVITAAAVAVLVVCGLVWYTSRRSERSEIRVAAGQPGGLYHVFARDFAARLHERTGRPVRVIETATYVGLVMLLALMTWVMYLDIGRLIGQ